MRRLTLAVAAASLLASATVAAGSSLGAGGSSPAPGGGSPAAAGALPRQVVTHPGPWDWPTYGHDAQHTFHGQTTLRSSTVKSLAQHCDFPTGDAVTATPTVVDGTIYVGSWDTNFYAVNLRTCALEWKTPLDRQDAVTPYPGENPRDYSSDGGLVTSSAWFQPGNGTRPDLVIFGGGYTLYALDAHTGAVYWKHAYNGTAPSPPDPTTDGARIFSSPVVFDRTVMFAVSVDGQQGEHGYVVGASLATGRPRWEYQTDVSSLDSRQPLNDGCGNVWSSGTVVPRSGLVVFDEADCHFANPPPTAESVFALHVSTGQLAWIYRPKRPDTQCDWDFGATPNAQLNAQGGTTFLGVGAKDGTYYSLNPKTGQRRWRTNVVFGGFAGGFIATAALDGTHVIGSTAIGDYGRFESGGPQVCDPSDPRDTPFQNPSTHAFDAQTGKVLWERNNTQSFAPTTIAGGMSFNGLALDPVVQVRSVKTGNLLTTLHLPDDNWSGIATVGDAVVLGTGTSASANASGVYVFTPAGQTPAVPSAP